MDYEKCYTYEPEDERPSKRRRLEAVGLHATWPVRRQQFEQVWNNLEREFSKAISSINEPNVKAINDFLSNAPVDNEPNKIQTGIILLEPGSSSRSRLLKDITAKDLSLSNTRIIALDSNAAPNLKTALKSICSAAIRDAGTTFDVEAIDDADEDEPLNPAVKAKSLRKSNGRRLLAYDLEILKEYADQSNITSFVIHLEDTEGFNGEVLSELIEHLSCWCDRISIVLLMNVSTSIDMLERRLSRAARSSVKSRLFPAATCEEEFEALIRVLMKSGRMVILGPAIIRLAAQRQGDYLQDIALIQNGLKYALMCAYFANPLTMFLQHHNTPHDHCQALRNTSSFRSFVRTIMRKDGPEEINELLTEDTTLKSYARINVRQNIDAVHDIFATLEVIWRIQRLLPSSKASSLATLYIQGLSGTLRGSASLRALFLALRKSPLSSISELLDLLKKSLLGEALEESYSAEIDELRQLIADNISDGHGRGGSSNTPQTRAKVAADLVNKICKAVEAEVEARLVDPKTLAFHEVFLWNTISPYREVFTPRPRQAIERALGTPHDYLDCDCCSPEGIEEDGDTSASQPATAVLYSLYKESGNLINVHDAWQAFQSVVGEAKDEEQTMALFQRSLAELKHLGMVKSTRKRIDHVAKVAWPGL